jgi:hypothetical protein
MDWLFDARQEMTDNPLLPDDQATIDRLIKDDEVRSWLLAKRARSGFSAFFGDRDTLRLLVSAVIIPILGFLALRGYDLFDKTYNGDIHRKAEAQAKAIQAQSDTRQDIAQVAALMPYLSGTPDQRSLAMPALKAMNEAGGGHNLFSVHMIKGILAASDKNRDSPNAEVKKQAVSDTEALSPTTVPVPQAAKTDKASAGTVQAVTALPAVKPSLAYIQFYGDAQAGKANQVAQDLRAAGVPVPSVENVVQSNPVSAFKFPQRGAGAVRYYKSSDAGAARFAADILKAVVQSGTPQQRLLAVSTSRTGVVEIWLPCQLPQCR